ncbi:hypothetical protein CYLTODRAFT_422822 [Cylindrobasidium torrendii FP15055 ss-10]|uniref:Sas10 C-terminal domain-containing protein n=1 Tax=Cylindrobasidium torrendii FP15055 ss-10 TaxID=1314674 RepID=A0A0D7BC75_9AGAR|nr:hypothetical protein CYLTODRAFT_422822 [Cylindrobasidium torrendii FP15055 ss-10]
MAKKRGSSKGGSAKQRKPLKRGDASVKKWNTRNDIPMDDEEQFHSARDGVLMGREDEMDDVDDEDVFSLGGAGDLDEDEEEDDFDDTMDVDDDAPPKKSKKKDLKKKGRKNKDSDSEESDESSEDEDWGTSRAAYYSSNAAQLESDDEEGQELEEKEAIKLQLKSRQAMSDDDFGLNDPIDLTLSVDDDMLVDAPIVQSLPTEDDALIRHFEKTDPESLALARDWTDTTHALSRTQKNIEAMELEGADGVKSGMLHLYYQTLLTYATTLAFYIHLRSTEKHAQHPELLRTHPIMSRLLTLKQSLITMEDLDFGNSDSERDSEEEDDLDIDDGEFDIDEDDDAEHIWGLDKNAPLEDNELNDLLEDAQEETAVPLPTIRIKPLQVQPISEPSRPKKKRKANSGESKPAVVFDLVEPDVVSSSSSAPGKMDVADDGYGEATELQHADAMDKKARKKTLRFHTSKIESASARRKGARNEAVGGDDDIPYKERRRQKDIRGEAEAKRRLEKQGGADLDDADSEVNMQEWKGTGMDVDTQDDDGYYDLVKKQKQEKKEARKVAHEENTARMDTGPASAEGPRALTTAMLKNRGLTPHRSKSVRNPRVKKRQKYDQAQKKVSSQKAVYKGGDGGKYDGERSGISKVVKSVRLS